MLLQPFAIALTPSVIRKAALSGLFPMGGDEGGFGWYFAEPRGMLPIEGIRKNRSLARALRSKTFRHSFDRDFEQVLLRCRRPKDNWIGPEIVEAYFEIHEEGWGHSSEVWLDDRLVGGVYGVAIGGLFCAESMFHSEREAGKIALWNLVEECKRQGFMAFDVQTMTQHLSWLGGFQVSHDEYLGIVREAAATHTEWGGGPFQT